MPVFPIESVLVFLLVFIRVLLIFSFMPIFSDPFLPLRFRVFMALLAALALTPVFGWNSRVFPETWGDFLVLMFGEAALGAGLGLLGRLSLGAVQTAGKIIGESAGFFNPSQLGPGFGVQIPDVGNVIYIFSLLLFFVVNGHHYYLLVMSQTLEVAPPGYLLISGDLTTFIIERFSRMFFHAVQLALPAMAVSLTLMTALAMLLKSVPGLNVLLESFPVRILVGLALLVITAPGLVRLISIIYAELGRAMLQYADFLTP